jgi:hypothetical protein
MTLRRPAGGTLATPDIVAETVPARSDRHGTQFAKVELVATP